jgi:NAD(P)H-nitrite reductase large subunit
MATPHYLIIGNGAAGVSAAEIIRKRDSYGRITIVTDEPYLFYSRPGIAYYISGQLPEKQLFSRSANFYKANRIKLVYGRITQLDTHRHLAYLKNGDPITYNVLLVATGASAVSPPFPGRELDGVLTFDSLDDAKRVIRYGKRAKTAVIVGGGITAMELAEGLNHLGAKTHLIQRKDRIWSRLFDEWESTLVDQKIRQEGITIHYNDEIVEILGKRGRVGGVRLRSGKVIRCQVVGVAIGVKPNLQLVEDLPIAKDKGILVNPYLRSEDPTLFAAGDVAQVRDRWTNNHQLDVLWPSAINEGRAAGHNMVDCAHGIEPSFIYQKDSPFNAALLFGMHLTVIGHVSGRIPKKQSAQNMTAPVETSYLSRGESQVWTAPFTSRHRSAWDIKGPNSLRIVMDSGRLVGAIILGNQQLADPLRQFIERDVDLSNYEQAMLSEQGNLPEVILEAWRDWHHNWS